MMLACAKVSPSGFFVTSSTWQSIHRSWLFTETKSNLRTSSTARNSKLVVSTSPSTVPNFMVRLW
nr:MAG: hypothetical protein J07AB56_00370 [Candidatus Nanosalinarum sp. J07AB56]